MSAHRKRQSILLGIALVAVAAFLVSFITGVRLPGRAGQDGSPFDGIPDAGGDRTRVEVLNAAGRPGIARMATRRLRESGFDVVYFGNAEEFGRDSSVVIDRVGDADAAARVAEALGIETVRSEPDSTLLLEVSVLLGKDWTPETTSESVGWRERLGRFLGRTGGSNGR